MKPFIKDKTLPDHPSWEEYENQFSDMKNFVDIKLPVDNLEVIPQICFPVKTPVYNIVTWVYITGWKLSWKERLKILFSGKLYTFNYPTRSGQPYTLVSPFPPIFKPVSKEEVFPGDTGPKTLTDIAPKLDVIQD